MILIILKVLLVLLCFKVFLALFIGVPVLIFFLLSLILKVFERSKFIVVFSMLILAPLAVFIDYKLVLEFCNLYNYIMAINTLGIP